MVSDLTLKIGADVAGLQKELNKATGQLNGFGKGLAKIGGMLAGAFSIHAIASFHLEVAKLAGEADGVRQAFEKLPNSTKLMEELKAATGGTVSELALMKRSVQASNFDISLKALPDLLAFASVRAQQTGQSVDYLVDSIVTGIGRKSPLILDNLGISAVALKEKLGGVSIAAADVGTVAKAVGEIAKESLSKTGPLAQTVSVGLQQLAASWDNLKVVIGASLNEGGLFAETLGLLAKGLDAINRAMADEKIEWIEKIASGKSIDFSDSLTFTGLSAEELHSALEKLKDARWHAAIEKDTELFFRLNELILRGEASYKLLTETQKEEKKVLDDEALSVSQLVSEWDRLNKKKSESPSVTNQTDAFGDIGSSFSMKNGIQTTASVFVEQAARIAAHMDKLKGTLQVNSNAWDEWASGVQARTQQLAEKIETDFSPMIQDALAGIGQALGSHVTKGMDKFGAVLLGNLGGILVQLGEMLIMAGVGIGAFQKSLTSLNPALAIGAGIALVALGTAISGSIKGLGASKGSPAASSGGGRGSDSSGGLGSNGLEIQVGGEFTIKGTDLVTVFNRTRQNQSRTTG